MKGRYIVLKIACHWWCILSEVRLDLVAHSEWKSRTRVQCPIAISYADYTPAYNLDLPMYAATIHRIVIRFPMLRYLLHRKPDAYHNFLAIKFQTL